MKKQIYQFPSLDSVLNNFNNSNNLDSEFKKQNFSIFQKEEKKKEKNKSFNEGFKQGFEQGKLFVFEELQNEKKEKIEQFENNKKIENLLNLIDENLKSFKQNFQKNLKQEIVELIEKVATKTIQAELTINPQEILNLVEKSLKELNFINFSKSQNKKNEILIFINSQDLENLEKTAEKEIKEKRFKNLNFCVDEKLKTGEIYLKVGEIEAEINCPKRIKNFVKQIEEQIN